MGDIVEKARKEYEDTGTLTVSTYAALTGEGFDAEILMAQFEAGENTNG